MVTRFNSIFICFLAALICSCSPGGLAPEHVYQSYALHYIETLRGSTSGPIVPPVRVIEIYRLEADKKWPAVGDFNHLPKIFETYNPVEIKRILFSFKERPQDYTMDTRQDERLGLLIKFSTSEWLFVPMDLHKEYVGYWFVQYCGEPYGTDSLEMMRFLKEKNLVPIDG